MSPRRQRINVLCVAVLVLSSLVFPDGTATADTKAEREKVQEQRAAVAAEIDTLRASDAQIEAALIALEDNVDAKSAALSTAEQKVTESEAAFATATQRVEDKRAEIAALEDQVRDIAIAAYVRPPSSQSFVDSLSAENISDAELKQSLLESQTASTFDVLNQLDEAREDLEAAQVEAEAAASAAESHRSTVETQLSELTAARDAQLKVQADVEARLDHRLTEADALAELDAELAEKIRQEQAEIARKLAAQRAAAEAAARKAAASGPITVSVVGEGSIVSVRGIRVHQSIADNLAALLSAADAAGISLAGGGYRSPAGQIQTRRNNCGTSNYAIYQMPSSSCRPPTARPGASMHERGLAIDFTSNGSLITSRSSAAFQWLAANAAQYGLYNLPSEPWHWSVNGR